MEEESLLGVRRRKPKAALAPLVEVFSVMFERKGRPGFWTYPEGKFRSAADAKRWAKARAKGRK